MYASTSNTVARSCSTSDHDPFSIYDDDTAHDHYFFLPAGQMEVKPQVKRTCSEVERSGRWSRSKPLVEKHSKPPDIPGPNSRTQRPGRSQTFTNSIESTTPARCECPTPVKDGVPRPPRNCLRQNNNRLSSSTKTTPATTHNQRHSLMTKDGGGRSAALSGDYCSLSVHAVAPRYPTIIRSNDAPIDEENFRKFANHLIRDSHKTDKNSNDYHDPVSQTRSGGGGGDSCSMETYDMDKCIDHCTCMLCVKAGRYHWGEGDGDSFIEEPCNCVGGRKNIVRRWLCMGVLALFLPCLVCYLPAKLCQKSCRSRHCSKTKLKDEEQTVKYVDKGGGGGGAEVKLQPTGML